MKVQVRLNETSQPVYSGQAKNTYTKGELFVVYINDKDVRKYPLKNIFDIKESY